LKAVSYSKFGWKICGDLKDIGLFLEMHSDHKKFAVFVVNGGAEQKTNITKLKIVPCEKSKFQGKLLSEANC